MLKSEEITKMFKDMGLGSQEKRERFEKFEIKESQPASGQQLIFKYTTTTLEVEDKNNV